jgi:dTDP-4-dehydrorhamnose reductase
MADSKKVLILGVQGMLGAELMQAYGEDASYETIGWDCEDIDVTDFVLAEQKIRAYAPDIIVNAVAYNAVDACEESDEEYAKALALNAAVPKFLAELAKDIDATLAHYSSDCVFDGALEENKMQTGCCGGGCCGGGSSDLGYDEASLPNPISRYGESKLQGERAVQSIGGKYYLIRLSKLFGKPALSAAGKKSFFEKILEAAQGKAEVTVVDDEKSCFTYAPDLAQATKALIEEEAPYGIYHLTNSGAATWYEAAVELFRMSRTDVAVKPVNSDMFPRPAKRPKNSALLNTKRPPLRPYAEALKEYILNQK